VLCSVAFQRFFFPVGQGLFPYFCAPRIPPRMRNSPGDPLHFGSLEISSRKHRQRALHFPHMSPHERRRQHTNTPGPLCAQTLAAGLVNAGYGALTCSPLRRPPAVTNMLSHRRQYRRRRQPDPPNGRRRPYKLRRQHTSAPPRPTSPPPVSPTPATGQSHLIASLAGRPHQHTEPPPAIPMPTATRPAKWPLPPVKTPAETHQRPSPPDTPGAGLANSGGGPVTASWFLCSSPPPIRIAASGHTDAGGNPPRPMPAPCMRRRSCRHRRRNIKSGRHPCPPPPPTRTAAAGHTDASGSSPRQKAAAGCTKAGGITPAPRPLRRRPVAASYLPWQPPAHPSEPPPAIPTPAATHQRLSSPDTPAPGVSPSGGGPVAASHLPCAPAIAHTQCRRRRY